MIYLVEITVVTEEPEQMDMFDHQEGEPYTVLLPGDTEHDVHHHFATVHNRDDIRYKILETYETWKQAEESLSSPITMGV